MLWVVRRPLTVLIIMSLVLTALPGAASAQTVGMAQVIFEDIQHLDPDDNFILASAETEPPAVQLESFASFVCMTCAGPDYDDMYTVNWFRSDGAVALNAVAGAALYTNFPYKMFYVAGRADMTGPAPPRIVKAFGMAVDDQVVIVEAYCCGYANPTLPPARSSKAGAK
jgi:hypothetical protein